MCPICNGPTVERPLFTSMYRHCERCESPKSCKAIGLDGAPFAIGDTVWRSSGFFMNKPSIVEKIVKRKITLTERGEHRWEWLVQVSGSKSLRECSSFTKNPPKQTAKAE